MYKHNHSTIKYCLEYIMHKNATTQQSLLHWIRAGSKI